MTNYLRYIRFVSAVAIVCMLFFGGCMSSNNVTHEAAGIIIQGVNPAVIGLTSGESEEAAIIKAGKFSEVAVNFQNLNNIPVMIKSYKVEYSDSFTGEKLPTLSFGAETTQMISGVNGSSTSGTGSSSTSSTASTTSSSSTSTSGATASSSGNTFTLSVVNSQVKTAMYRTLTDPTDNRMLTARLTFYGNDFNGNGLVLETSVTILP